MSDTQIIKDIANLLLKNSKETENDLIICLRESRLTISGLIKLIDKLTSLQKVAELKQENTAYRYAITCGLNKESQQMLQKRYEQGLKAIQVGVNPFDLILKSENLESMILKVEKYLESTKSERDIISIKEIEDEVLKLDKCISIIRDKQAFLNSMKPDIIKKEAINNGLETD